MNEKTTSPRKSTDNDTATFDTVPRRNVGSRVWVDDRDMRTDCRTNERRSHQYLAWILEGKRKKKTQEGLQCACAPAPVSYIFIKSSSSDRMLLSQYLFVERTSARVDDDDG